MSQLDNSGMDPPYWKLESYPPGIAPQKHKTKREESLRLYDLKSYSTISLSYLAQWNHRWLSDHAFFGIRFKSQQMWDATCGKSILVFAIHDKYKQLILC